MAERGLKLEWNDPRYLKHYWDFLVVKLGLNSGAAANTFDSIISNYQNPRRRYHNEQHLGFMFKLHMRYRSQLADPDAVGLFILFHDIELSQGSNNEDISAVYAQRTLNMLGASPVLSKKVADLVRDSKDHVVSYENGDREFAMDFDMAILATEPVSYEEYAKGIAFEYGKRAMPYLDGRQGFLEKLERRRIFSTDEFYDKYEFQAKWNIKKEIQQLKKIKELIGGGAISF